MPLARTDGRSLGERQINLNHMLLDRPTDRPLAGLTRSRWCGCQRLVYLPDDVDGPALVLLAERRLHLPLESPREVHQRPQLWSQDHGFTLPPCIQKDTQSERESERESVRERIDESAQVREGEWGRNGEQNGWDQSGVRARGPKKWRERGRLAGGPSFSDSPGGPPSSSPRPRSSRRTFPPASASA